MADPETIDAFMAISKVKAQYCRFLDTKDWAGFAGLLVEDFVLDVSEDSKMPPTHGRDVAVQQIQASLATARTAHHIHAPEIEIDGDVAHGIWAMQDRVVWDPPHHGIRALTGYGHYHERYVRQKGQWKIAAVRLTRLNVEFERVQTG